MSAHYMLDTDICIRFRSRRSARLTNRLLALEEGEVVMSLVTYGELRFGAEKSREPRRAEAELAALKQLVPIVAPDEDAAEHYGAIRAQLERRGETIGPNDLWIAAHARAAGLTLVTNNEREFRRVPDLAVENWAAEEAR